MVNKIEDHGTAKQGSREDNRFRIQRLGAATGGKKARQISHRLTDLMEHRSSKRAKSGAAISARNR